MIFVILGLVFISIFFVTNLAVPAAVNKVVALNEERTRNLSDQMEKMFVRARMKTVFLIYTFGPIILGVAGYMFFPPELKPLGLVVGGIIGFMGPSIYVKHLDKRRKTKFQNQLVDTLMILSSSLRGGLSLIQAIEVIVEEIPSPSNEEFGIVLGENKMGVSFEESLAHLYKRMPSTALDQMITAILLARETGGNLPVIFQRIINTIRENRKIQSTIDNLTLQGKIQGAVMSLLPILFALIVTSTNPNFFDIMLSKDLGKMLLMYAFFSELVGAFLIWKISTFKEF